MSETELIELLRSNLNISVYNKEDWDGKSIVIEVCYGNISLSKDSVVIKSFPC